MIDAGQPAAPLPGIEDPDRLANVLDVHIATVPVTITALLRRAGLTASRTVEVTVAYITVPSLTVIPRRVELCQLDLNTVELVADGHAAALDIDNEGFVAHYPGLTQNL